MPHLTGDIITRWLMDFREKGHRIPGSIRVLDRELEDFAIDASLVVIRFELATTDTYLQRKAPGTSEWFVTFAPRSEELVMTSVQVQNLADEFHMVSRLADYLEARTAELLAAHAND